MSQNRTLGRGLSAFLVDATAVSDPTSLSVDLIQQNPWQPRYVFDEHELGELAQSIREHGIIQPLVVRPYENAYQLIAGERRLRASKMVGLTHVPVVILKLEDHQMLEIAILENIQRQDLNPIEEAQAYQKLLEELSMTQSQIAQKLGKSRSYIANMIRLNHLSDFIKQKISDGLLSVGHAKAIMMSPRADELAQKIIDGNLSVREAEEMVANLQRYDSSTSVQQNATSSSSLDEDAQSVVQMASQENCAPDPDLYSLQLRAERAYSAKMKISMKKNGGRISLDFSSQDDLYVFLDKIT